MRIAETLDALRQQVAEWRQAGETIAFVPTMGNLHEGHLKLVREAKILAEHVVVSIFVNPMQFGEGEDFDNYPRTVDEDKRLLEAEETALLYLPDVTVMYPHGQAGHTEVTVPGISGELCGAYRPGHFTGVATVVSKLFNMVLPDIAVFGEKDFQQLMVIRRMVEDLAFPIEIVGVATCREEDGLARSSRNRYLNAEERERAPILYQMLTETAEMIRRGERDYCALEYQAKRQLATIGFVPDYVTIRRAEDLQVPQHGDNKLVILAAAYLGRARLIDNLRIELAEAG